MAKELCTSCREYPRFYCGLCRRCIRETIAYLREKGIVIGKIRKTKTKSQDREGKQQTN